MRAAWQVARDERALREIAPHAETMQRYGWEIIDTRWERLRGRRFLVRRPSGVAEWVSQDQMADFAAWVAGLGGA